MPNQFTEILHDLETIITTARRVTATLTPITLSKEQQKANLERIRQQKQEAVTQIRKGLEHLSPTDRTKAASRIEKLNRDIELIVSELNALG